MKHELLYETQSDFTAAQGNSGNVTSITPGVAYVMETGSVPSFNDKLVSLLIQYYVSDISSPTKIFNLDAVKNNLKEIIVDKIHIPASDVTSTYQFTETGLHRILFRYKKLTSLPESAFMSCPEIVSFRIPKTLTSIANYAFKFCTSITCIDIPDWCTMLGNAAFEDCSGITKVFLPADVSIGTGTIRRCAVEEITLNGKYTVRGANSFSNEWHVKKLNISSLNDYCSSSGLNYTHASPTSVTEDKVRVYDLSTGNEVTDIAIPDTTTLLGWGMFRKWAFATTVSIPDSVTSIGQECFASCENLILPSGLTSIGAEAFRNCGKLTGNLVIPNTTTYIGQSAFENCSGFTGLSLSENLTSLGQMAFKNCKGLAGCSVVVPSGVTILTGNTFTGVGLKDLTVEGNMIGPSNNSNIGNGTGKFEVSGYYKCCWANTMQFKNVVIHGDFIHCNANREYGAVGYFFSTSPGFETFRVEGNYSGHTDSLGLLHTYSNGEAQLKFIELLGPVIGKVIYDSNGNTAIGNNAIIHLGHSEKVECGTTGFSLNNTARVYNRISKIYVGDGSSQAADQAVLDQYLADADWAAYSSKLDLWYNYHGEYREE